MERFSEHISYKPRLENDIRKVIDDPEVDILINATFRFPGDKIIKWDGKSRNGYDTYEGGRGTIIYGSEGTVFVDRGKYVLTDRSGEVIRDSKSSSNEAGTALGGGGDMTTTHVINFFDTICGKAKLTAPIDDAAISMAMVHYANIAYRIGKGFAVDDQTGRIYDRDAMKLWSREYEQGWKLKV